MGRPKTPDAARQTRVIAAKVNQAQGDTWDALRKALGSGGPVPREADALRWLIQEECKRRGLRWPADDELPGEPADAPPPEPPEPASPAPTPRRGSAVQRVAGPTPGGSLRSGSGARKRKD